MKIIAYGARVDEIQYFKQWAKDTGNTLEYHTEFLDENTVEWAKGFDGINSLQITPYAAGVFEKMHAYGIKFLTIRNVGTDNIDMTAMKQYGIRLSNVPAYSPAAIAEFALTDTLYLLRNMGKVQAQLQAGDYEKAGTFIGKELGQQTVGVMGTGHIGQVAIKLFKGFGAKVIAYDPYPMKGDHPDFDYVSLEDLFKQSDIIDLHVPGIEQNTHIINEAAFNLMKPGAIVINTARPNLIDTQAMLSNLKSGKLAGVGIDTYEYETEDLLNLAKHGSFKDPLWDELLGMPNVVLSPHIAYYTETAVHNMVYFSLQHLVDFLTNGETSTEVTGPAK
ncbi:D-2-hydroxyisocaproate dehydrogenase [Lacticaseibacillus paracasei]|uniref:(R)-2-hydroxyisocaproate dehydrogenase n=1 Tax=Lacticaseibacillus paracasei (strain ATCC 334 / BCRC 17002 / CCUG 31169 / CIP 107868 / KCTC 3260 / NRRL B-441) TaxID=321967 RepID=Q03CR3_LACP3|nr:D-2-hydroxyisocaproate dehydrogenase [Lacticaseibacillus paracasei]ABJ69009.1 (R)-2-hydroxyisocaproate dehydrogenase [Lacticaseibacillus paracasei ATCC 334]KRK16831.1 lactate dehydrogenase [Lacticaseibacillus casei DSM 20011 = JCM 1134 = ATCC 393]OSY80851.1 lactate dehydrogenase [Lacticaseibacillus paracasei]